jgi:hypothetical protein
MNKQDVNDLVESLRRDRDELRVQMHLLKADARDEWATLEKKWAHLQTKSEAVGASAGQVASEVGAALKLLGDEVRTGYRKIRDTIKAG